MSHSYRPAYHAAVPSGWANDPNGTIFFRDKAHLFYQHYPYKPEWGTMHWGHFATEDFVRWENLPVALRPEEDYEALCGCCSGSAIEKDGRLYLLYTCAQPDLQRQCLAVSDDGVRFEKDPGNPIVTADMLHEEVSTMDFRDPRLFQKDGLYYAVAGVRILDPEHAKAQKASGSARRDDDRSPSLGPIHSPSAGDVSGVDPDKMGYGNLILMRSPDLHHWEYVGKLLYPQPEYSQEYYRLNGVYECPDYFVLDGEEVLLSSPQNLPPMGHRYQNIHSALYMLGKLDFQTGRYTVNSIGEIDCGFDFYASQTLPMPDGRIILLAWKEMWDRNFPTQKEGWAGTYTLPRELRIVDGQLIQTPVRELARYRQNHIAHTSVSIDSASFSLTGISGDKIELSLTLEPGTAARAGVKVFCGKDHETAIYYDRELGAVVFDRSRSGVPMRGREADVNRRFCDVGHPERLELRLFLDVCSVEAFLDGGKHVMTGNVYPDPEDIGVAFFCEGGAARFRNVEKYDIVVEESA